MSLFDKIKSLLGMSSVVGRFRNGTVRARPIYAPFAESYYLIFVKLEPNGQTRILGKTFDRNAARRIGISLSIRYDAKSMFLKKETWNYPSVVRELVQN